MKPHIILVSKIVFLGLSLRSIPWVCVFMYAPRCQQGGKPGKKGKRKKTWDKEREPRKPGGRDEGIKEEAVLNHTLTTDSPLQRWAPGLYSKWAYWLENCTPQSTNPDPKGTQRASSIYGWTCWTNSMSVCVCACVFVCVWLLNMAL